MSTFVIKGGKKLKGSIEATAGKNAPIAVLCAALLMRGKVELHEMTQVEEVQRILEILESIGVEFSWKDETTIVLDTSKELNLEHINKSACERTRASLLLFGALAARSSEFKVYKSGGCKLGNRSVRPHMLALQEFGIHVRSFAKYYLVETKKLHGADVVMYESGDTATENAIMAAVLAPGTTTITFASSNYMVQDVCNFLVAAGAKISGIGTTTLTITGVKKLKPNVLYNLTPDPVDAMAWISLAITTKSPLTIKNCPLPFLQLELLKLKVMGQKFIIQNKRLAKNKKIQIADIKIIPSELSALPDKLYGRPYPGFNIDNVPLFVPILTQAKGQTLVHEWCYENRAVYYAEFKKLGADVLLLDTHRAMVGGPSKLKSNTLVCPPAIRPGMAILIGMIAAEGISILKECYPLERAYEHLLERLKSVGVNIEHVEE